MYVLTKFSIDYWSLQFWVDYFGDVSIRRPKSDLVIFFERVVEWGIKDPWNAAETKMDVECAGLVGLDWTIHGIRISFLPCPCYVEDIEAWIGPLY